MADDEPAWDFEDVPALPAEPPAEEAPAAAGGAAPAKEERPKLDYSVFAKAPKPKYTLHWVRPVILGYRYITDYRQFYYNDVIDWLDKRNRGIERDPPNCEEWSERAFKMYNAKNINKSVKQIADLRWITCYRTVPRYYSYHTRAYYSLKYQPIL
ncbi:flightin [Diachasma alloeum]|uniref:flightin n=1 Tax=Diachasma alloeum TaxID=454923 RepID=UPI0007381433|nr:flightin [Diachasma alloeum]XP_015119922.1 flightin [Diachasma alloeum]XP_015119923.1 flightin [Diachasma alloeum]XP_015119924.1 flightin [Diachasma alloeum]